jgi:hypothetical protein
LSLHVQFALCGQEVVNAFSAAVLGLSSGCVSSQVNQEHPHDGSPPLREDDKNGHYVFAVGDNLTSRYNFLPSASLVANTNLFPWLVLIDSFLCLQIRLMQKWEKVSLDDHIF